jgi:hypothetical protein
MALERLGVSDLKEQIGKIAERLDLKGIARFTLTKDVDAQWTLMSIGTDGTMKFVYGPTGIREMNAWLDGVIWMMEKRESGQL